MQLPLLVWARNAAGDPKRVCAGAVWAGSSYRPRDPIRQPRIGFQWQMPGQEVSCLKIPSIHAAIAQFHILPAPSCSFFQLIERLSVQSGCPEGAKGTD